MTSELNDGALYRQMCLGDQESARLLYERLERRLFRFLLAYAGDVETAEDLTHEVFLRLWQSCDRYREEGNFRAFLYRIARNVATDSYRHRRATERALDHQRPVIDTERNEAWMDVMVLHQALSRLRPAYRDVLVLRFLEQMKTEEVAEVLGKSAGAVRVLQHRALQALRKTLKAMEEM